MNGSKSAVTVGKNGLKKLFGSISSTCSFSDDVNFQLCKPKLIQRSQSLHPPPPPPPPPACSGSLRRRTPSVTAVDCSSCRPTRPRRRRPAATEGNGRFEARNNVAMETRRKSGKVLSNGACGWFTSCSSGDSDEASFSSDREDVEIRKQVKEETETLLSSKSLSYDSPELYAKNKKNKKKKKEEEERVVAVAPPPHLHRRNKENKKVVGIDEGTAVVKQSTDPYADFRSSVLEMVVENQIVGDKEFEQLLTSYLALNSRSHHPIILQVFSDIWQTLFNN